MQRRFHPVAAIFPLMQGEEFNSLVESIRTNGLLNAITLAADGSVLDGRNRERACLEADVEPRYQTWNGKGSLTDFVFAQNRDRRHLTATMRALAAMNAEPFYAAEAKKRQRDAGKEYGRGKGKVKEKVPEAKPAEQARDKAAKAAKTNPHYVSDLKKIKKEAPQVYAKIESGEMELPAAKQEIKQRAKQELAEKIRREPSPPPSGPYRVIAIDPPWKYDSRADDLTHRARNPFPDMTVDEIKALPVADYAHPDCTLWLWTPNAFLREAFDVLDAWGFEYKTTLTWFKDRMGTGDSLRGQTEHCLMAERGKPVRNPLTNQTTALFGPLREHSRKPDEFYQLANSLCPGNKVEFFARERRSGWTPIMSPELGAF